jgi:SAM-dependent methyltransferase
MAETKTTVSRDEIVAAYRVILGREPSAQEIPIWLGCTSVGDLRDAFLSSSEFNADRPNIAASRRGIPVEKLSRNLSAADIEWRTDPLTASRLLDHVKETWTAIGESRPHWSVLSSDQFLPERIAENESDFFASGKGDLIALMSALHRHGVTERPHILEYGCGIGRVTGYLAGEFPHVTACDISMSHLAMARKIVGNRGNVTFKLVQDDTFGMTEPFDIWLSHIVLQHNPPPVIALILRKMFSMLAPDGIAIFQLPTYCIDYRFAIAEYLSGGAPDNAIEVHCLPQPVVFSLAHEAGCMPLEVREDDAMGPPSHWLSNTFIFRKPKLATTAIGWGEKN